MFLLNNGHQIHFSLHKNLQAVAECLSFYSLLLVFFSLLFILNLQLHLQKADFYNI